MLGHLNSFFRALTIDISDHADVPENIHVHILAPERDVTSLVRQKNSDQNDKTIIEVGYSKKYCDLSASHRPIIIIIIKFNNNWYY